MDLHILGCPERNLTSFLKKKFRLCVLEKFCGRYNARTDAQNFMKIYNIFTLTKIEVYKLWVKTSQQVKLSFYFFKNFGKTIPRLLLNEIARNFLCKILSLRGKKEQIYVLITHSGVLL